MSDTTRSDTTRSDPTKSDATKSDATDLACDVCIIGAGSAGLSVAAGLAQLGRDTILVEHAAMGGDCLNVGCVPSKALLAAAKRAHAAGAGANLDFAAVQDGVAEVIGLIAPHDSQARFESLGVRVLRDMATFQDDKTLAVGARIVRARVFVIASGSRPALPPIAGLNPALALTNETIFALRDRPEHLVIIGGGPIGIEMAQAHRRLGSAVTLIQRGTILPRDEPELVEALRHVLLGEGIVVLENAAIRSVLQEPGAVSVRLAHGLETVTGTHLLVATGRRPDIASLGLDEAGIAHGPKGIQTDRRLRTSRRHIFALGDAIDGPNFTHVAGYQAGIVVRNVAFRLPAKVDYRALPWVTYTDPELAHVGMTEGEARARGASVETICVGLARNDRAVTEGRTEGLVKLVVGRRGRILGASLLAPAAGEAIGLWCLAVQRGLTLRAVVDTMLPYPTFGEAGRAAAAAYFAPTLFGARTRRLVGWLDHLPRF